MHPHTGRDVVGALELRHEDAVDRELRHGLQVGVAAGVDANEHRLVAPLAEQRRQPVAGARLRVRGDAVLEVDDHRVRA